MNDTPVPVSMDAARPGRNVIRVIDRSIGWLVEVPAALLVLMEVGVLLLGVVSRYVFHKPLLWTDKLAQTQFIWLAMLGAVVAFRHAEHISASTTSMPSSASGC